MLDSLLHKPESGHLVMRLSLLSIPVRLNTTIMTPPCSKNLQLYSTITPFKIVMFTRPLTHRPKWYRAMVPFY